MFSTAKRLAVALGVKTRVARPGREASWNKDLFLFYPAATTQFNEGYFSVAGFFQDTKFGQRQALEEYGLPIPAWKGQPGATYVVRPLNHTQGRGFRVTADPDDYIQEREYISVLFPKTHEYRMIFVFGRLACLLTKRGKDGKKPPQNVPWGHQNTNFVTIPYERSNLAVHTDALELLSSNPVIKTAHYVGVDILYNKETRQWAVCEFNSCPALTIPENIQAVTQIIKEH